MVRSWRCVVAVCLAVAVGPLAVRRADANWLTRLGHVAGDSGGAVAGKAARLGTQALDHAAAAIKARPPGAKGAALAVHVTPEGHWKFVNASGEVFTAGTAEELARAVPQLAPEAAQGKAPLALYLTEGTVFEGRAKLKELPRNAELHVVAGAESYPLAKRRTAAGSETLFADVRPNIAVELGDIAHFDEALWQLQRPLDKSNIRVVALEPGGPEWLPSAPRFDAGTQSALVDAIEPGRLSQALGKLRGQTVLVTGAVEGDALRFTGSRGSTETIALKEVVAAAEAADVNLVVLRSSASQQPGGRNWLWQRVSVKGLDEAIRRATFADFLNAIAARRGGLLVTASDVRGPRVQLTALPSGATASPVGGGLGGGGLADWAGNLASEWTGKVMGDVVTLSVHAHMVASPRQKELDLRLVPYVPAWVQGVYLGSLLAGVIGWRLAGGWFARIWPAEQRREYQGRIGYLLARGARLMAFVLLFLPLAGVPALLATMAMQLWRLITLPAVLLRRRGTGAGAS